MTAETHDVPEHDDEFDRRMRAVFESAMSVDGIPGSLLRPERRSLLQPAALLCVGLLVGALAGTAIVFRPALVQTAISHERNERTLRGNFMPPQASIASYFGLAPSARPPGLLQMAKPCLIAGRIAYHMTTWLDGVDGGGMVTAISFAQLVDLPERSGWWPDTYWRVVRTARGMHVLLFAQNRKDVEAAAQRFR